MSARLVVVLAICTLAPASAGELTRRFERTLERVLRGGPPQYTEHFLLADLSEDSKRRFADFSGDLSGRYLGATALAGPAGLEAARALAPRIFELQRPDGGFGRTLSASGATEDDMARLWGHGRMLVGLVEYFDSTGDPGSLEAARGLGDFLVAHAERFNASTVRRQFQDGSRAHGYICWTQNVEALALLARATGDPRYRTAASAIAEGIERRPGQHAHGWLSSLRGLALLAHDDETVLPELETAWEAYVQSENLLWTGGPPEYFAPSIARDEGCASADWVRLNLALWRLTQNERYLEAAEDGLFNALFANQAPTGDFGHIKLSDDGFDYGFQQAWWCCTLHGLRALEAVRNAAFRSDGETLHYDLPVDGQAEAAGLELTADADIARDGRVSFRVLRAPAAPVTLYVHKPARTTELRTDAGASREPWLKIDRTWTLGETLSVEYEFDSSLDDDVVKRGPWTLGVSEGGDPAFFNEEFDADLPETIALEPGDRPSRLVTKLRQAAHGGGTAAVTLRPISERWESPGHAMRWVVQLDGAPEEVGRWERAVQQASKHRKPLGAGFAAGMLFAVSILWLSRRRRSRR